VRSEEETKMKATMTPHGVIDETGELWDFLGSGFRYGFDTAYAVRRTGDTKSAPTPATTLPWPYPDNMIEVEP